MVTATGDEWKVDHCPALVAVRVLAGKWKTSVLWLLRTGPIQFGELRRALKGISPKMLTEHLRQLEADGLIRRQTALVGGVTIASYRYTDYGATLIPVLDALVAWGITHALRSDTRETTG